MTLNPRTEYYTHRAEIEAFMTQPAGGGGEEELDALLSWLGARLNIDRSLGGLVEDLSWSAPETSVVAIEWATSMVGAGGVKPPATRSGREHLAQP